jgi:hypothetical protein
VSKLPVNQNQLILNNEISQDYDMVYQENDVNVLWTLDSENMNNNQVIVAQQLEIMAQQLELLESDDFP